MSVGDGAGGRWAGKTACCPHPRCFPLRSPPLALTLTHTIDHPPPCHHPTTRTWTHRSTSSQQLTVAARSPVWPTMSGFAKLMRTWSNLPACGGGWVGGWVAGDGWEGRWLRWQGWWLRWQGMVAAEGSSRGGKGQQQQCGASPTCSAAVGGARSQTCRWGSTSQHPPQLHPLPRSPSSTDQHPAPT